MKRLISFAAAALLFFAAATAVTSYAEKRMKARISITKKPIIMRYA